MFSGVRPILTVLAMAVALGLAGCSSVLSEMPQKVGGLPEGVPERPVVRADYPAVHDMPATRTEAVMTEADRKKLEAELAAARAAAERRAAAPVATGTP